MSQYYLVLMNMVFKKKVRRKVKFRKKIETVEVERVRGEKNSLLKGSTTNVMVMKVCVV